MYTCSANIFVCNLIFLLFLYQASVCVCMNNTSAVCILLGPGFISCITKNKVLPCIQPASFHIPQESCNLFSPAHLPPNNPGVFCPLLSHWLKGAEFGLPGQYKEGGSLLQSLVGGDGMKSDHHLHQQVGCTCCFIIHYKHTVAIE